MDLTPKAIRFECPLHSLSRKFIRFIVNVGLPQAGSALLGSWGGTWFSLMICIIFIIVPAPLLMFSSLRWTKASDNRLTFSIMILLHFITSYSHINLLPPYKNNHCVLFGGGSHWGVEYQLWHWKQKHNEDDCSHFSSSSHGCINSGNCGGRKLGDFRRASRVLARAGIFPKTCVCVCFFNVGRRGKLPLFSTLLCQTIRSLCYINPTRMTQ